MITISENYYLYINILVLLFLALFFFLGYKRGLVRSVISMLFSILSFYIAWMVASVLCKFFPIWPVNIYAIQGTPFEDAAKQIMNQFSWFIVLVILLRLLFLFISYLLKSIKKIPVIKNFDELGGGIFGLIEAFFWIFFICIVLNTRIFSNGQDVIDSTLLKPINSISSTLLTKVSDELDGVEGMSTLLQGGHDLANEQKENLEKWLIENGYGEAVESLEN